MVRHEDIDQQQVLLATHRRTLAHYLRQLAQLGTAHEPPGVTNGIAEAHGGIAARRVQYGSTHLAAGLRLAGSIGWVSTAPVETFRQVEWWVGSCWEMQQWSIIRERYQEEGQENRHADCSTHPVPRQR